MTDAPTLASGEQSICDFSVQTEARLRFLRRDGGKEPLEISVARQPRILPDLEPLAEWMLAGTEYKERATLFRVDDWYVFWTSDAGAYHIDPANRRIEIPDAADEIVREQRLWGVPLILCSAHRGDFPLHSAAVEVGSGAVLLAAPSRHGKTTLGLAFHRSGYRLLSEDLVCCRSDPSPKALPGPALARLRPDVYDGFPPAGTHVVEQRPGRVYLALNDERRGSSAPVPIRAIVFLRESENLKIETAPAAIALRDVWHLNFRLPTHEGRSRSFQQLARLADTVPLCNVYRPLRLDNLCRVVELIVGFVEENS